VKVSGSTDLIRNGSMMARCGTVTSLARLPRRA
jgi:hypothetical protein